MNGTRVVKRLGIPGLLRGWRCIAVDGDAKFLRCIRPLLVSDIYKGRLTRPTP